MKKLIITSLLLLMVGCSSSMPDKHYYRLESDFDSTQLLQTKTAQKSVWIESVTVANYLDKTGIVYQTDEIQYITANNNLWLTTLSNQIQERLVQDLSVLLPNYLVTTEPVNKPTSKVKLFIDAFHGRYTGEAIIKGRWVVTNHNNEVSSKNFDYQLRVNEDGYQALVKTLSKGLQEEQIDFVRNIKL